MPCSQTHGLFKVVTDFEDHFLSLSYIKQTCQKSIGYPEQFNLCCKGQSIYLLLEDNFFKKKLLSQNQFFFYMQWRALKLSLHAYLGLSEHKKDCEILSIVYENDSITLTTKIFSPKDQPPIQSCSSCKKK